MQGFSELNGANGLVLKKILREGKGRLPNSGENVTVE